MTDALQMAGTALSTALKACGITQDRLAELLGVSQSTVSLWVRGKNRPEPERLPHLAELIGSDSIDLVLTWWPELADRDRLATIRKIVAGVPDDEIAELEEVVRRWSKGVARSTKPDDGAPRTSTAGSPAAQPAAVAPQRRSRSNKPPAPRP